MVAGDTGHGVKDKRETQVAPEEHGGGRSQLLCLGVVDDKGTQKDFAKNSGLHSGQLEQSMRVSEVRKGMGEKVPGGNSTGEAEYEQRRAQEHALYPEGNGEPWEVVDERITRS